MNGTDDDKYTRLQDIITDYIRDFSLGVPKYLWRLAIQEQINNMQVDL